MTVPSENANDYKLSKDLNISVDEVRDQRSKAYATLRKKLRKLGYNPPEDNEEFRQWMATILKC